mgnify:CR=1 FL=1
MLYFIKLLSEYNFGDIGHQKHKLITAKTYKNITASYTVFDTVADRFQHTITCGMTVAEINELDLVYAPPVAPVYDPILIAASQAMKKVEG